MGYVPLAIWFVCITTLLLILTRATLARMKKQVTLLAEEYSQNRATLMVLLEGISATPAEVSTLVKDLAASKTVPVLEQKIDWLAADKALYRWLQAEDHAQFQSAREALVATAKLHHKLIKNVEAYNGFVKTPPTQYGAWLFGYARWTGAV